MGVIGFLGRQRDAALGANGSARHFAVRQLVFGQHRGRWEDLIANVALDPATSSWCQQSSAAGRAGAWWMMDRLHVGFQLGPRLASFATVGAVQTQVEDSRRRIFRFFHLFRFCRLGRPFDGSSGG